MTLPFQLRRIEPMTIESWLFSAKRAWQDPWVKVVTIATTLFLLGGSGWFIANMIALRHQVLGPIVLHYNIYVGVDALGAWGWIFLFPVVWLGMLMADFAWAFGVYREDVYQAWCFFFLAAVWSIPWMMALWHLVKINQ